MSTNRIPDLQVTDLQAARVRDLLNQGFTPREVAEQTGISRRLIDRIGRGRFVPGQARPLDPSLPSRAFRCAGCGGMVFRWPCLACFGKALLKRRLAARTKRAKRIAV